MAEKITMGPESLVLSKVDYPVTFATLGAIEAYTEALKVAKAAHAAKVTSADKALKDAEQEALDKLKGELK